MLLEEVKGDRLVVALAPLLAGVRGVRRLVLVNVALTTVALRALVGLIRASRSLTELWITGSVDEDSAELGMWQDELRAALRETAAPLVHVSVEAVDMREDVQQHLRRRRALLDGGGLRTLPVFMSADHSRLGAGTFARRFLLRDGDRRCMTRVAQMLMDFRHFDEDVQR